jgi:signal peptidase II
MGFEKKKIIQKLKSLDWYMFVPLVGTWLADYISKLWAIGLNTNLQFGIITLSTHHNHGIMLGWLERLPPLLKVVMLSTTGALLVCAYFLTFYLVPLKSKILKIGLSLLLGGIIGNITDRVNYGYVIDFIIFKTSNFTSPVFNIADLIQMMGYVLAAVGFFKEAKHLWPDHDIRNAQWVNKKFQTKFSFLIVGLGLGVGLVTLVLNYTFFKISLEEMARNNTQNISDLLVPYLVTIAFAQCCLCMGLFAIGKIISHRIAGPFYATTRYAKHTIEGKSYPFKLRTKDEFKDLEVAMTELNSYVLSLKAEIPPPIPLGDTDNNILETDKFKKGA